MSFHSQIAQFKGPKEVAELIRIRDLVEYPRVMASLKSLTDIEIMALHKALTTLMQDGALPAEYDMMVEAINMAALPRIKQL